MIKIYIEFKTCFNSFILVFNLLFFLKEKVNVHLQIELCFRDLRFKKFYKSFQKIIQNFLFLRKQIKLFIVLN